MKLATFSHQASTRIGVVDGREIVDLAAAAPQLPTEMIAFLAAGESALAAARAATGPRLPLDQVRLLAPVPRPGKFLAVGLNYADHIAEMGMETPDFPNCFAKLATAVTGPYDPVYRPRVSDSLDYEAELGLVIGKRCRHVPRQAGTPESYQGVQVDARDLVASSPGFFRYMGSLTTPPCSEGVNWFVVAEPARASAGQIEKFTAIVGANARPLQPRNNRLLLRPARAE